MFDVRGVALGLTARPPFELRHRPQGPEQRPTGDDATSALGRQFRSAVADAIDGTEARWLPRLSRYPY